MNSKNILINDIKDILDNSYKTYKFPPNNRFVNTGTFLLYAKEVMTNMDKHTNIIFPDTYEIKKPIRINKPNYIYMYMPTNINNKSIKLIYKMLDDIVKHDNSEENTIVLDFSGTKINNHSYINILRAFTNVTLILERLMFYAIYDNTNIIKLKNKNTNEIIYYLINVDMYKSSIKYKELHVICDGKNAILSILRQFDCFAYKYNNYTGKIYYYNNISLPFNNKIYELVVVDSEILDTFKDSSKCKVVEGDIPEELFPL